MNLQQYAGVIASKGLQEKAKPGLMKKNIFFSIRKLPRSQKMDAGFMKLTIEEHHTVA
jgi:hypothetical protein